MCRLREHLAYAKVHVAFVRTVQKLARKDSSETRMQGVGDAKAYGVLPPINAADVHDATAVFKRSVASRVSASRRRTMSLPFRAWAFTQL